MKLIKRALDFTLSLIAILILLPVFLIVSFLVFFKLGRPIFFRQKRPGKDGRIFGMYKFRTMLNTKDSSGQLLSDEKRLTSFGKFLRASSLDELPELLNVLKGDMSLVGPRPLLVEYLDYYTPEQKRRHLVRPGITGWAQVNGRNAISWEEKFKLDVWYVDNWRLWLDIKIFFLTFYKVFKREGISNENSVTMEKFKGSNIEKADV
ncbi:MAG TPA: sugar transferase [Clostridia bacterium]|nr:sugar transferase [Clostridia bacterium]